MLLYHSSFGDLVLAVRLITVRSRRMGSSGSLEGVRPFSGDFFFENCDASLLAGVVRSQFLSRLTERRSTIGLQTE